MNVKKSLMTVIAFSLVTTFLIIGLGTNYVHAGEQKILKWGTIAPFSGAAAPWGIMSQYSYEIAVEDINAGGGIKVGDDHYMVKLIKYDHAWDPAVSLTATKKAVYDDNIKFLTVMSDEFVMAAYGVCAREKVLLRACGEGVEYPNPKKFPWLWNDWFSTDDSIDVLLEAALKKYPNFRRIAGMTPDGSMGLKAAESLKKMAPQHSLTLVDQLLFSYEATDFYPALTGLLAKGVDMIDLGTTPDGQGGLIIKQARELGFKGIFLLPNNADFELLLKTAGAALNGSLIAPQFNEMPTEVGRRWQKRFVAKYGSLQHWAAWYYDSAFLLKAAIEKANSLDTEKVNEVLGTVSFDGCSGKIAYNSGRFFTVDINVMEVVDGKQVNAYHNVARRWR